MKLVELYRNFLPIAWNNRKKRRRDSMLSGAIVIVGGSGGGLEANCLTSCEYCTDIQGGFRTDANLFPDLQEPSRSPSVFSVSTGRPASESVLLVAGGCAGPAKHHNSIRVLTTVPTWQENNEQGRWSSCAQTLRERGLSCASSCQFEDGSCFLAGGYDGFECLSGAYLIRPQSNDQISLLNLNPLPTRCKNAAALTVKADPHLTVALIFGGWDEKRTLATIFEYSISEDRQECILKGIMPTSLEGHTVTKLPGNRLAVICGGFDGINVVNTIYTFDMESMKMSVCDDVELKIPRENHVAFCVSESRRNFLVVAGGWDGKRALKSCEVFEVFDENPILRRIEDHKMELNVARNRPGVAFVRGFL